MNLEKNPTTGLVVEFFGPTIEFLTLPEDDASDFCVLKGIIPPGVSVPLHSHPDLVNLIFVTKRLARFFQEAGRPATGAPQPVTPEDLARFAEVSAKYGYWNATPEENEAVGIQMSF